VFTLQLETLCSSFTMMQATTEKADEAAVATSTTAAAEAVDAQSEKPQSWRELIMLEALKCVGVALAALIFTAIMKAVKTDQSPEL
jgi:hypothetical protein